MVTDEQFIDATPSRKKAGRKPYVGLSPSEMKVFEQVLLGKSNKEIAEAIGVRVKTVKFHMGNILKKTGATSKFTLVAAELKLREERTRVTRIVDAIKGGSLANQDLPGGGTTGGTTPIIGAKSA